MTDEIKQMELEAQSARKKQILSGLSYNPIELNNKSYTTQWYNMRGQDLERLINQHACDYKLIPELNNDIQYNMGLMKFPKDNELFLYEAKLLIAADKPK